MHANTFDRYEARPSFIHRLDPRVKVVVTVLFILSNVILPDGAWLAFLFSWAFILWVNILADLRLDYAFKRSFIALPFALAAVTTIFTIPGEVIFSFQLGPWPLTVTAPGLTRFISILIRSWLSVQMAILLTATTQFPDLMHALRHLRVPSLLVAIISFMYRYLFVLVDEAMRLLRAREARSARLANRGGGSIWWRAKVAGNMVGQLFLRSYERSDRVYNAMLARGYRGHFYTLNAHVMKSSDWLAALSAILLMIFTQVIGYL
jgi:cobalt/nickel transport system permease protein